MPSNPESYFVAECRAFAAEFPTPNVKRAIALCEDGTLRWADVAAIFASSLREGLRQVRA